MPCIQGFVLPVKAARKDDYVAIAAKSAEIFFEYGAIDFCEAWADDVPDGEVTSFPMAVKCEPDEAVVFSWVTWPDRETANACMGKMEKDKRWEEMMPNANDIFSMKRMIFGFFDPVVTKRAPTA